jgi:glutamine amidotransferase
VIGVLAYGIGNPASIVNMLDYSGWDAKLVHNADEIDGFERIILPGVGHFDGCAKALRQKGFEPKVNTFVDSGRPFLAICVGAQMLGVASDEGLEPGLGLMDLAVKKFPVELMLPIPRMSWGEVQFNSSTPFAKLMNEHGQQKYYFSHSYYLDPVDESLTTATSEYGMKYSCVVERDNIIGVQFHPEKSHKFGMTLLDEFAQWVP